ncbi:MAG: efflux RND transporter periplasmic adaptor subunit [Desulfobulbaceae bacterium]|nr:efflux RND transporter periplasmic adaptor subunit [Desulfobulbaceae bacterium]
MIKRIVIALLGLAIVIGAIAGVKVLQIRRMMENGAHLVPPPTTVTSATVQSESWESTLTAVGSLEAEQGVTVASEVPGKITRIAFTAGVEVAKGDLLVELDSSVEQAQLLAVETTRDLARITRERSAALVAQGFIAQADFDSVEASLKQTGAQVDNLRAVIAKKAIRAPFAGRLGVRMVNLGQMLGEGDLIVTLQVLDPLLINFQLPQHDLAKIATGLTVRVSADALGDRELVGAITTINPKVDDSRTLHVQARVANTAELLRPGMFVSLAIVLPEEEQVLTIPATAVLYAPYGDSVFVIEEKRDEQTGTVSKAIRQQFIRLGGKRGDFVSVTNGLHQGETVVSTGVFKLRNGQSVVVDNTLAPEFNLRPQLENK